MKKVLLGLIVLVLAGCSSQKGIDTRPDWVQQRPLSNFEFIGIASSSKITYKNNYIEVAKENALSDLSSEISVNISSTSVLSSIETSTSFRDEYSSVIKSKTIENLEGYRMQASYDSKDSYWVYYSLSKEEYKRREAQKKNIALNKSKDFYLKSVESYKNHNLKESFIASFKALVALRDYWNEGTEVSVDGETIILGNEILKQLSINLNEIHLVPAHEEIDAILGKSISKDNLSFRIIDKDSVGQKDIPVIFKYSESRIINNRQQSNADGLVSYQLKKSGTKKEFSTFRCEVDIRKMIEEASRDYMLLKLYSSVENPKIDISIRNIFPKFYLDSHEFVLGKDNSSHKMTSFFKDEFASRGIKIVEVRDSADFVLRINSDTRKISKNKVGVCSSELDASIDLFSNKLKLHSYDVGDYKGRGESFESASINAYNNSKQEIKVKIVQQIIDELF